MSSAHRVSVNSRGPRTKPCEYWWQKARGEVLVLLTQERVFYFFCFSNMGVLRVMKEMKLSCCKCHFEFFLPQWQMMKKYTHPSLLISFFTPSKTARPHKRDEALSSICTSPIIHLVCPQTFAMRIVFNFSWCKYNTQEKFNKSSAKFWVTNKVYYKRCASRECCFRQTESLFTLLLNRPHSYR